jgi:hypothetical protein
MPRNSSFFNYCLLAAERVQYWLLGRDKDHLFPFFLTQWPSKSLQVIYKYDLVKTPKIPSQVERLSLYGFQMCQQHNSKQGLKKSTKEKIDLIQTKENPFSQIDRSAFHAHCCVNQKAPYLYLEEAIAGTHLNANRVINCHLKEYFLACRKLRDIHQKGHQEQKHYDFVSLNPQKPDHRLIQDQEFWEEMIHSKKHSIF